MTESLSQEAAYLRDRMMRDGSLLVRPEYLLAAAELVKAGGAHVKGVDGGALYLVPGPAADDEEEREEDWLPSKDHGLD